MLLRVLHTIIISVTLCVCVIGQSHIKMYGGGDSFSGLKKTNEQYLRDQITRNNLDSFDLNIIQENTQILKNNPGIGNAKYSLDTIDNKIYVTYIIDEIRTLLPIMNFGRIEGNLWYQMGFSDNNWLGIGHQLATSYQNNDGLHSGQIYLKAPRLRNSKFGYSASLSSWRSLEPLYFSEATVDYEYNNNSLGLTGIYNFTINKRLEIGATGFIENYKKADYHQNEDLPGPNRLTQNKFLSKVIYDENFINYHYFYQQGHEWKIIYQNVYTADDQTWFNIIQAVAKSFYRPNNETNIAMRLKLGISTNNNSPFAPFVVDSHMNIRGVGNRIDRGTAQAVFNFEYRRTVWHQQKWGVQVVGFTDIGSWRNPGGGFNDLYDSDNFRQFIGGGFRLIYQKVFGAILRVDYGIDLYNRQDKGLVIGLGQYF